MSEHRRRLALRLTLGALALTTVSIGVQATVAPRRFYEDFPLGAGWVERLPPYNEHLVTDVGGLYLAFTVLFAWAAATLRPALAFPVTAAFAVAVALHLAFHAAHLENLPARDAIGQMTVLGVQLALALAALALARAPRRAPQASRPPRVVDR